MQKRRPYAAVAVMVLALLLLPAPAGVASADGSATFPRTGGSAFYNITLPQRALVLGASLDLEGATDADALRTTVYDFTDTTSNRAWAGRTGSTPPAGNPSNFQGSDITTSSQIRWRDGNAYGFSDWMMVPYYMFMFNVKEGIIQSLSMEWTGYGYWDDWNMGNWGETVDLFMWNAGAGKWDRVAGGWTTWFSTFTVTLSTNPNTYLDPGGNVYIIVMPEQGGNWVDAGIWTDYVKLTVTGQTGDWPTSPALDIGNDGDIEWQYTGKFRETVHLDDSVVRKEFQSHINGSGGGNGTLSLPLKFTSTTRGKVGVRNVTIDLDTPPVWLGIPGSPTLNEDTTAAKLVDLTQLFSDDRDFARLQYRVTWMEDSAKVEVVLNQDGRSLDFRTIEKNWNGVMGFRVSAMDASGQFTLSPVIDVTVRPVNDKPVLERRGVAQYAVQDTPFALTYTATDVDGDPLTFSDNTTLFDIDPVNGTISFTPANGEAGIYKTRISVKDPAGTADSEDVTFTVQNVNDPPVIDTTQDDIDRLDLRQDVPVDFTIAARDPDAAYGDAITFSDNTALFDIGARGSVRFTPANDMAGERRVTVSVADKSGTTTSREFVFDIQNVNDPPEIMPIPDLVTMENIPFSYRVNATDPDIRWGDRISFGSYSPLFAIDKRTGTVSFTPTGGDVGRHSIRIVVKDRSGTTANATMNLVVVNVNEPPVIEGITGPAGDSAPRPAERVLLVAHATDPDRDDKLNYTWKEGNATRGYGETLSVEPGAGTHRYTLVVSDGNATATSAYTLVVKPGAGIVSTVPGETYFPYLTHILVLAAGIAATWLILSGRRKRGPVEYGGTVTPAGPTAPVHGQPLVPPQPYLGPVQPGSAGNGGFAGTGAEAAGQGRGPGEPVGLKEVKRLLAVAEHALESAGSGTGAAPVEQLILDAKRRAFRGEYALAKGDLMRAIELASRAR